MLKWLWGASSRHWLQLVWASWQQWCEVVDTEYYPNKRGQQADPCSSHTSDYHPASKFLGKDENSVLSNLGMRTVATPANRHCLLRAFKKTKEIKYGNSDPGNEKENESLKQLIRSMKNEFMLSKSSTLNSQQIRKHSLRIWMTTWIEKCVYKLLCLYWSNDFSNSD